MTTGSRGYDCLVSLDSDQVQGRLLAGQIEHRIVALVVLYVTVWIPVLLHVQASYSHRKST